MTTSVASEPKVEEPKVEEPKVEEPKVDVYKLMAYNRLGDDSEPFKKIFVQKSVSLTSQLVLNQLLAMPKIFAKLEKSWLAKNPKNPVEFRILVVNEKEKKFEVSLSFVQELTKIYAVVLQSGQIFELSRGCGKITEPVTQVDESGEDIYSADIFED